MQPRHAFSTQRGYFVYASITLTVASEAIALRRFIFTTGPVGLSALGSVGFTALGTTRVYVAGT